MSILVSLIVLSILIFFHELGHYAAARAMGVRVEVFSIGFGKKIASFHKWGNEWRLSAIPLGGYVRMKGQDDSDPTKVSLDSDSYNTKTPQQRIFILLAGPVANFMLAFFLFFFVALGGPNILSPVVGEVLENGAAYSAGVKSNDRIVSINSHAITTWEEMSKHIEQANGSLAVVVERDSKLIPLTITPRISQSTNIFNEVIQKKMVGIAAAGVTHKLDLSLSATLNYAIDQSIFASTLIFTSVKKLIFGEVPAKELGGVISIVKITSDASEAGFMSLFFFAALISVNLGVLNLLPIPALDGGHIMFNTYELISRRSVSEAMMVRFTLAGWVVLFMLMGLGLYNDINRLMGTQ